MHLLKQTIAILVMSFNGCTLKVDIKLLFFLVEDLSSWNMLRVDALYSCQTSTNLDLYSYVD
jgi:hypothetical protein